jgi:fatty-acid peroxygenase
MIRKFITRQVKGANDKMSKNKEIPHDKKMDNSIHLMQEGYLFIKNRMDRYKTNVFSARILGKQIICITGKEAVQLFYDEEYFERKGAAPYRVQQTLFGVGAIQTLDGDEHKHRKKLFLSFMTVEDQKHVAEMVEHELRLAVEAWESKDKVVVFDELAKILCKVACKWTETPISEDEIPKLADQFISMVYALGAIGPKHWKGRYARNSAEMWAEKIIKQVRDDSLSLSPSSILNKIAFFKDVDGQLLETKMAAIELLNVLRPIVAIATYITFSVLALHEYPEYAEKLRTGTPEELEAFVEEVRRFYPFGPFLGAKVKKDFVWKEYSFKKGTQVLLDVFGFHKNPEIWSNPNHFDPDHFKNRKTDYFNFIPQGGGDPSITHRCPGEGITVEVMKTCVNFFVNEIHYEVPVQNLSYPLNEMPTLPKSGMIIQNVKKLASI